MRTSALPDTGHGPLPSLDSRVQVIAHRGASATAPENTLSAIRAAVACGADAVEIDVRQSLDGEFVVIHDATVGRTTNVVAPRWRRTGPRVDELTLAQLRGLDAGSWKGPSFVGERIPTLEEVLDVVASTRAHLLIEIKRTVGSDPRQLQDLVALLEGTPLPHRRITVQSFDSRVVQGLRNRLPDVALAILTRSVPGNLAACSQWADQVSIHHRSVDHRCVDAVRGWGMRCVAWTVNSPTAIRRVLGSGVDGVITDRPAALLPMAKVSEAAPPHRCVGSCSRPGEQCA